MVTVMVTGRFMAKVRSTLGTAGIAGGRLRSECTGAYGMGYRAWAYGKGNCVWSMGHGHGELVMKHEGMLH